MNKYNHVKLFVQFSAIEDFLDGGPGSVLVSRGRESLEKEECL